MIPQPTLSVLDRVRIASFRGDDVYLALVDDTYPNGFVKNIGAITLAKDIKELHQKAKSGNQSDIDKLAKALIDCVGKPTIIELLREFNSPIVS